MVDHVFSEETGNELITHKSLCSNLWIISESNQEEMEQFKIVKDLRADI